MTPEALVISAIESSPLNRGLSGSAWLTHAGNVPVVNGGDVTLFDHEGDRIYQIHVLFVSRGKAAVASAKAAIEKMFVTHGAEMVFGLVPAFRRDVAMLARWVGMKFVGTRATSEGPCDLFVVSKEMWSA